MDCQDVKNLMSAYYDQELSTEVQLEVAQHLAGCEECTTELAGFGELSAMAKGLSQPVPPPHIWSALEAKLDARPSDHATTQRSHGWLIWIRQPVARLAVASAALVLVAIGWFGYTMSSHHDEHQMAAVFGQYLDQFQVDPQGAQAVLLTNYESRAVVADQAINTVGYRPLVAEGVPPGYTVVSTHVLKMPCCTCVQCLCQRDDGTTIAIFEHDDKEPKWFGGRASKEAVCGGKLCSLVTLDDRLAATWRVGARHISVIGARDMAEVSQLVAWFDKRRSNRVN